LVAFAVSQVVKQFWCC